MNNVRSLDKDQLTNLIEKEVLMQMNVSGARNSDYRAESNIVQPHLLQNYPNPFNPVTLITFSIPENEMISLIVYDVSGKEVKRIIDREFKDRGEYSLRFDGTNLPSGIYFYSLKMNNTIHTKQMILIK